MARVKDAQDRKSLSAVAALAHDVTYIETMAARYAADPKSVPAGWREFFEEFAKVARGAKAISLRIQSRPGNLAALHSATFVFVSPALRKA